MYVHTTRGVYRGVCVCSGGWSNERHPPELSKAPCCAPYVTLSLAQDLPLVYQHYSITGKRECLLMNQGIYLPVRKPGQSYLHHDANFSEQCKCIARTCSPKTAIQVATRVFKKPNLHANTFISSCVCLCCTRTTHDALETTTP